MTKIAFFAQHLGERGTGVALFDYALHNQAQLGNESIVLYDTCSPLNNAAVVEKFRSSFEVFPSSDVGKADAILKREACDAMYVIKSGGRNDLLSSRVPTLVHAVFPRSVRDVHGSAYAFVSEWLSKACTRGKVPWVPHIVGVGQTNDTMRAELKIPQEATVYGCYGGRDSFDIDFVKRTVIPRVLGSLPDVYFLFMNIEPFIDDPKVIFLDATADLEEKTAFINSCDVMLHARRRGETFGLAVGEFSLRGKPVMTFGKSRERAHIDILGETALVYKSAEDLYALIRDFDRSAPSAQSIYSTRFAPGPVMKQFSGNLLRPALEGDLHGARKRLGLSAWDPTLWIRPKVVKTLNRL